jgi:small subunit ribosomal protein S20
VAHSLSSKKRIRQTEKRRALNRVRKGQLKAQRRRVAEVLAGGDPAKAEAEVKRVFKLVDQVAAKGTIHKNAAARVKSRLQRRMNRLKTAKA